MKIDSRKKCKEDCKWKGNGYCEIHNEDTICIREINSDNYCIQDFYQKDDDKIKGDK